MPLQTDVTEADRAQAGWMNAAGGNIPPAPVVAKQTSILNIKRPRWLPPPVNITAKQNLPYPKSKSVSCRDAKTSREFFSEERQQSFYHWLRLDQRANWQLTEC